MTLSVGKKSEILRIVPSTTIPHPASILSLCVVRHQNSVDYFLLWFNSDFQCTVVVEWIDSSVNGCDTEKVRIRCHVLNYCAWAWNEKGFEAPAVLRKARHGDGSLLHFDGIEPRYRFQRLWLQNTGRPEIRNGRRIQLQKKRSWKSFWWNRSCHENNDVVGTSEPIVVWNCTDHRNLILKRIPRAKAKTVGWCLSYESLQLFAESISFVCWYVAYPSRPNQLVVDLSLTNRFRLRASGSLRRTSRCSVRGIHISISRSVDYR